MTYAVVNRNNSQIPVTIVNEAGQKDTIFVQPKSRVKLAAGHRVSPGFLIENRDIQEVKLKEKPIKVLPKEDAVKDIVNTHDTKLVSQKTK